MYIGLQHTHSSLAYLVLLLILIAIGLSLMAWFKKGAFTTTLKKAALYAFVATHVQFLLGIVLYFVSPLGWDNLSAAAMKDAVMRLYAVEHPFTMILGIVIITLGYMRMKKADDDRKKLQSIWLYYTIGLVLILSRIPWNAWP
jgi:uncharacterized membrane protein YidH (DUF202 family)